MHVSCLGKRFIHERLLALSVWNSDTLAEIEAGRSRGENCWPYTWGSNTVDSRTTSSGLTF